MAAAADRLSQALAHWQTWDLPGPLSGAPSIGRQLAKGSGHSVYNILCDPPLVARIRHQSTRTIERPFEKELTVWSMASEKHLAPGIVYVDASVEAVICYRGDSPTALITGEQLGILCRHIHRLPPVSHSLTLRSDIEDYLKMHSPTTKLAWRFAMTSADVNEALCALEEDDPYLCHNDLTAGNLMLCGGDLTAIDWEYAAMGSRYFDIAIAGAHLPPAEHAKMLQAALGEGADNELMRAGRCIASLVTALWQIQFTPDAAPNPDEWLAGIRF
jgi:thiamine kinase